MINVAIFIFFNKYWAFINYASYKLIKYDILIVSAIIRYISAHLYHDGEGEEKKQWEVPIGLEITVVDSKHISLWYLSMSILKKL